MMSELERIARALCMADGFDPDTKVFPHDLAVGVRRLPVVPRADPAPQWQYYEYYVRATLSEVVQIPVARENLPNLIDEIIAGRNVPEEPDPVIEQVLPNWREKMGLQL